jgi:hypothetical protein
MSSPICVGSSADSGTYPSRPRFIRVRARARWVDGRVVDQTNEAYAYASCVNCQRGPGVPGVHLLERRARHHAGERCRGGQHPVRVVSDVRTRHADHHRTDRHARGYEPGVARALREPGLGGRARAGDQRSERRPGRSDGAPRRPRCRSHRRPSPSSAARDGTASDDSCSVDTDDHRALTSTSRCSRQRSGSLSTRLRRPGARNSLAPWRRQGERSHGVS